MKTGTLILEVYAELLDKQSVDILKNTMHQPLISVSKDYSFDYKRFEYFAAVIIWVLPLDIFWKNDNIYNTLVRSLDHNFHNWTLDITLLLHDRQS